MSTVGIQKTQRKPSETEIKCTLSNLLNDIRIMNTIKIPNRARIIIKPNICFLKGPETGATVDPLIVRCLVEWFLMNYDVESITIGEADATELDADLAFRVLGWQDIVDSLPKVKILNLTKDENVRVRLNGLFFKELYMSKTYMESDFLVSVAKLKTHCLSRISCVLKTQFGALPKKSKSCFHTHLDEVIHDVNKVRLPDLCVVDGIVGMEEYGPIWGIPKPAGVLVVGNDPVATDHVCARVMRVDPHKISYLKLAIRQKLGNQQYQTFGEKVEDVTTKFECGRPLWKKTVLGIARTALDTLPR